MAVPVNVLRGVAQHLVHVTDWQHQLPHASVSREPICRSAATALALVPCLRVEQSQILPPTRMARQTLYRTKT
eukprot:362600-Amphidinium_carterae.4